MGSWQTGTRPQGYRAHVSDPEHLQRGAELTRMCRKTSHHGTCPSHTQCKDAPDLLTQNLRVKSARSRTEYKREKSAPCEQNKSGREHVQEQTSKKEKKPEQGCLWEGADHRGGKETYGCTPFCTVCGFSNVNRLYMLLGQKWAFLKLKCRKREMRLITPLPQGSGPSC